ncbi:lytic polysaccharide monooxygenase [Streptomyces sp. DSM 15324]|uniref:lytic polysaccharide monooxygenase n=1 Tax=Streptomyces sp. DSM 15324 TaxID=1739111 RepID=UPI00074874E9|nr:lytic polysaccharide monooxygenase [Streptomyces sp. DSM 15324]KUO12761.1 chitin-binding protein [Streptomyces sp. DSM 15324]
MPRMTAHRSAALTAAALSPLLLNLWAAGPALAHGAPTQPSSRVYGCSPEGTQTSSAACKAAIAANGTSFAAWDNLRVANVNGRDRQTIPDGRLCSGGLSAYKGLDLARADWPTTRLTPGGTLRMTYASTIPHTGTFRLYLTKQGYDPAKPLTWDDLPERPFAEIKDPTLSQGAYRFSAKLPADRTGRQVLYTIWQNSSTPDTYYSCSDVVFSASGTAGGSGSSAGDGTKQETKASATPSAAAPAGSASTAAAGSSGPAAAAPAQAGADAPVSTPVASATGAGSGPSAPLLAGGATAVLVLTGGVALALRLRRR